jgi:trk system potassium uptake protein
MTRHALVVGGGRIGTALLERLVAEGAQVTVVERDADRVAALRPPPGCRVVHGDGADPAVLEAAGVRTVDVVAAVTGDDPGNLVVCALARLAFGVPRTVSRVEDPAHLWLFTPEVGVDLVVDRAALLTAAVLADVDS